MTAPSNANTSELEAKGVVWHNLHGQECIGWTLPKEYFRKEPQAPKPLVTAASAQAAIDAEKGRADRLSKALEWVIHMRSEMIGVPVDTEAANAWAVTLDAASDYARAALQQETQP